MIDLRGHTPAYAITADGKPFANERVLRIEVTDAAGHESDELLIVLDDAAPQIARPREGAVLTVSLGYRETGLVEMGRYVFEEIERNGFERTMTLLAKSADHTKGLKEPRTESYEGKTLGEIVETVAGRQGLTAVIADRLKSLAVAFIAQTEESDQALLTRLGKRYGAVIAPKDGRLLVTERRTGKTASGQTLAPINVSAARLLSDGAYYVRLKPRSRFSEVIARWQDRATGTIRKEVVKGAEKGPSMTIRDVFQSAPEARHAAQARAKELRAGEGELSLELIGDPYARAESPIVVAGVSLDADGPWIASMVTHVWDYGEGGGAVTTVEAEFGTDDEGKDEEGEEPKRKRRPAQSPSNSSRPDGDYVSILDR